MTPASTFLVLLSLVIPIAATELLPRSAQADGTGWIDEAKLGVLAHDVGVLGHGVERGPDVNGEILFASPGLFKAIGSPRPDIGGSFNTAGRTSYGYIGLTWDAKLLRSVVGSQDAVFVAGSLGGAVHDGHLDSGPPGHKLLGTRGLFRESVELGYQITGVNSISVIFDHLSNAGIGRRNAGLNDFGVRTGLKF